MKKFPQVFKVALLLSPIFLCLSIPFLRRSRAITCPPPISSAYVLPRRRPKKLIARAARSTLSLQPQKYESLALKDLGRDSNSEDFTVKSIPSGLPQRYDMFGSRKIEIRIPRHSFSEEVDYSISEAKQSFIQSNSNEWENRSPSSKRNLILLVTRYALTREKEACHRNREYFTLIRSAENPFIPGQQINEHWLQRVNQASQERKRTKKRAYAMFSTIFEAREINELALQTLIEIVPVDTLVNIRFRHGSFYIRAFDLRI